MLTRSSAIDLPVTTPEVDIDGTTAATRRPTLLLRMNFSDRHLAVLSAFGELDAATAPSLAGLLWPRLQTKLAAIVIDLSNLTFLAVAGLELLSDAHAHAWHRGIALGIVNNTRTVEHALAAAGLADTLPTFADLREARAAMLPGQPASAA